MKVDGMLVAMEICTSDTIIYSMYFTLSVVTPHHIRNKCTEMKSSLGSQQ